MSWISTISENMVKTPTMANKAKRWLVHIVFILFVSVSLGCEQDNIIKIDTEELKLFKEIAGIDLYMDLPVVESNTSRQGCAYYENTLFVFHNTNDIVEIYDFKRQSIICITDMTYYDLNNIEYHCNNANFGGYKYDISDVFPLLYVSMENINQRKILVLRITVEGDKFIFNQIQTIQLPNSKDLNLYYPNSYLDTDNNAIWVSGYTLNNYYSDSQNKLRYIKFDLPNYNEDKIVYLDTSDTIQVSEFDSISATQGGQINGGTLFQVFGVSTPLYLKIIDLQHDIIYYSWAISDYNQAEPEGLFIVDNHLYYSTQSQIFKIRFE